MVTKMVGHSQICVVKLTATIILLDDLLTQYGPEAISLRGLLRQSIPPMADRIWHEQANQTRKSPLPLPHQPLVKPGMTCSSGWAPTESCPTNGSS